MAAANTGLTLMKIPKKCAGTRRNARRSARNGTTDDEHTRGGAAGQRGNRRRMGDQRDDPDRHVHQRRHRAGGGRSLDARRTARPTRAVEQDVARPAHRGEQAEADTQVVGGRLRAGEQHDAGRGEHGAAEDDAASQAGRRRGEAAESATVSGPRNSSVIARPRPIRSIAMYSERFMAANTAASPSTGTHCLPGERPQPRPARPPAGSPRPPTGASRPPPTGPITGKASAPTAAPVWFDKALPSISTMPAARPRRSSGSRQRTCGLRSDRCPCDQHAGRKSHSQNASMRRSYTLDAWMWSCGTCAASSRSSTAAVSPAPRRSWAVAARRVPRARGARDGARGAIAASHQPGGRAHRGRGPGAGQGAPPARRGRGPDPGGAGWNRQAAHRPRLGGDGRAHRGVPTPVGRSASRRRAAPGPHQLPTGGLAEGACDVAVVRTPPVPPASPTGRFDDVIVGLESRYCAVAADDPLARRRQLRTGRSRRPRPRRRPAHRHHHPSTVAAQQRDRGRGDPRRRRLARRDRRAGGASASPPRAR